MVTVKIVVYLGRNFTVICRFVFSPRIGSQFGQKKKHYLSEELLGYLKLEANWLG